MLVISMVVEASMVSVASLVVVTSMIALMVVFVNSYILPPVFVTANLRLYFHL